MAQSDNGKLCQKEMVMFYMVLMAQILAEDGGYGEIGNGDGQNAIPV